MTAHGFPAAVLRDFDSTLGDAEPLRPEPEREELEARGGAWTPARADRLGGVLTPPG
ncbi:hypothetical protein [Kocuria rhizosphaericola]|uniref:hypothetical protein n=1 Tax=Kocuria rhizosphaericola TaxID=3376284 RepID=UPI0037AFAA14